MFTTEHLHLRQYRLSDDDDILAILNDVEVQDTLGTEYNVPRMTPYVEQTRQKSYQSMLCVIITLKSSGEFVGRCTLVLREPKTSEVQLAIIIGRQYWDKGYGSETVRFIVRHAFHEMAVQRISLQVVEGNQRGLHMFKKVSVSCCFWSRQSC